MRKESSRAGFSMYAAIAMRAAGTAGGSMEVVVVAYPQPRLGRPPAGIVPLLGGPGDWQGVPTRGGRNILHGVMDRAGPPVDVPNRPARLMYLRCSFSGFSVLEGKEQLVRADQARGPYGPRLAG